MQDFINEQIEELIKVNNFKVVFPLNEKKDKYKDTLGLVPDPDDDKNKDTRYQFSGFMIQPPVNYKEFQTKKRIDMYKEMKRFLEIVEQSVSILKSRGLGLTFKIKPDGDTSLPVIRLVYDAENEYAAMYQQEDDDKDGIWESGDFLYNLKAKNANIHTFIHEYGHKYYYEVFTNDNAEAWKEYYEIRKYREKNEFVTEYAKENHREDFAETFAVYALGASKINELYDKMRVNKNVEKVQKLIGKLKSLVSKNNKELTNNKKKEDEQAVNKMIAAKQTHMRNLMRVVHQLK